MFDVWVHMPGLWRSVVAVLLKIFDQEFEGCDTSFLQDVHAFSDININETIGGDGVYEISTDYFQSELFEGSLRVTIR